MSKIWGYILAFIGGIIAAITIGARAGGLAYRSGIPRSNPNDRKFRKGIETSKDGIERSKKRIESSEKRVDNAVSDLGRIRKILETASIRTKNEKSIK